MSDPIDEIEKFLTRKGWTRRHLMPAFGDRGRISEIMNRKRPLTIGMIRVLVFNYGLDAEKMIQWYPTKMQPKKPINTLAKAFKDVSEAA